MREFKTVPFDPGYSAIAFSFTYEINFLTENFLKLRNLNQKRFELSRIEPKIIDLINKASAFYLGCILWGGFIRYRFVDSPKEIEGNPAKKMTDEEKKDIDCALEVRNMLEFISIFDRDCKYFLKHSAKISDNIIEILNSYVEFAEINKNFVDVRTTADVKTPEVINHFNKFDREKLDELCEKIYEIIGEKKIEKLLEIGFFK